MKMWKVYRETDGSTIGDLKKKVIGECYSIQGINFRQTIRKHKMEESTDSENFSYSGESDVESCVSGMKY